MRLFQVGVLGTWLLASACAGHIGEKDTEADELVGSVQDSLQTWRELKADRGTSYEYTRTQQSWVGSGFQLTIEVVGDAPAMRSYEGFTLDPNNGARQVTETWQETGSELGSHDLTGYDAVRVEALYDRCLNEVLERGGLVNDFYVSFHDDGLLEACFAVPQGCADDCADGVGIDTLTFAD